MNYSKLLIAADNGPTAEKAATKGFELTKELNAEIAILSAADPTLLMTDVALHPMSSQNKQRQLKKFRKLICNLITIKIIP